VEKPGRPATLSRPSATTVTSPKLTGHAPAGRWIEVKAGGRSEMRADHSRWGGDEEVVPV
jgi:hypothetical protein